MENDFIITKEVIEECLEECFDESSHKNNKKEKIDSISNK